MKRILAVVLVMLVVGWGASAASGATITLYEWATNVDGTVSTPPGDFTGSYSLGVSGAGSHSVLAFFDFEIDETNDTFSNEYGSTSGTAGAGQSWEIDEPGWREENPGDIYDNFVANSLDNNNASTSPDDVSMAMGWNFILTATQIATIVFTVSESTPDGFYLAQTDPDSKVTLYLTSSLTIREGGTQVPEPGTLMLLAAGLLSLAGYGRMRRRA